MKLFVFTDVKFTKNYHQEGGAVVVARDENRLREILDEMAAILAADNWHNDAYNTFELKPGGAAVVYEVGEVEERVYRFPDKGCC